jgi:hypothetical protein
MDSPRRGATPRADPVLQQPRQLLALAHIALHQLPPEARPPINDSHASADVRQQRRIT